LTDPAFNPFPGLRPFEPEEDYLFFGRERQVDELLRRVRSTRLLSVVGESGAGKSSLVRCGLIPSLYSGLMAGAGSSWRVAILRPGEDPIGALATALDAPGILGSPGELETTNRVLLDATLRRGTRGLIDAVRMTRLPPHDNLLVVVDQFEELFRFRQSSATPNSRDEAALFVKLLLAAANQRDLPVHIVLTMRSDFIGRCMEFLGLPEAVATGLYLVPRLSRDELRLAITGPVAVAQGQIAPRLVTRLLNDVGDDPDQLPILQHALMRTWDDWKTSAVAGVPIDLENYERVGGMHGALSLHAEEAYAEASAATSPALVSKIFKALTDTSSDARGIRRPTSVEALTGICEASETATSSETAICGAIEIFRSPGRSFLMPPANTALTSRSVIDISHESLMRCWRRLQTWTEEERASAEMYQRISQASAWFAGGAGGLWRDPELELGLQWRAQNRPTAPWARRYDANFERAMNFLDRSADERERIVLRQEQARKRKLQQAWSIAALLGALFIACGVFAWFAVAERNRAETNLRTAAEAVDEMLLSAGTESGRVASEVPEVQRFRSELLSKAEAFYVRFLAQKPNSESLQQQMAVAHFRLGDIHRLNQEAPGESQRALEEYTTAAASFATVADKHPDDMADREQEANAYNWLGETERILGRQTAAEHSYNQALGIQKQLSARQPRNNNYTGESARSYYNRGIVRTHLSNPEGADSDYRQAIALLEPLSTLGGSYRQELDRAYHIRANLLNDLGRTVEAEQLYRKAIASHQSLLKDSPGNRDYQLELDEFCNSLALLYSDTSRFALAEQWWRASRDQVEKLSRPSPSVVIRMAKSAFVHAVILRTEGPLARAADEYRRSIELLAQMDTRDLGSATLSYHQTYGQALEELARLRYNENDNVGAIPLFTNAIPHYEAAGDQHALALDYAYLAAAQLSAGNIEESRKSLEYLRNLLPQLTAVDRDQLSKSEKTIEGRIQSAEAAARLKEEKQRTP
jgi:tetratricopeptide (TPR) repeat protein